MKAYIVFERDDYNEKGNIYKEGYPTAEEAYEMVKTFLREDYETYKCFSEEVYSRQIKRLEKSYDDFLKEEYSCRFCCKYYNVEEINIKGEILMNTFKICEEDGSFLEEIPQRGIKIWLASSYLTYSDYWMYLDNTVESDSSTYSEFLVENPDLEYFEYLKVLTILYNDLVSRLNDFTEQDSVEWEGYHLFRTNFRKLVIFTINKRDVPTEKVGGITRV